MITPAPVMRLVFPLSFDRYFKRWMDTLTQIAAQESPYAVWIREYTRTYREVIR